MAADGNQLIGSIILFAGNFAPRSWAYCDGQLLAISSNEALFSILGTTYGGDGRTTFGLPDLRGRVPIGPRTGPGLSTYRLGERSGQEAVVLTTQQLPSHNHLTQNVPGADQHILFNGEKALRDIPEEGDLPSIAATSPSLGLGEPANLYGPPTNVVNGQALSANAGLTINNTGNSQEHYNVQPFLAVNYIIALQGLYPSRN